MLQKKEKKKARYQKCMTCRFNKVCITITLMKADGKDLYCLSENTENIWTKAII